MDYNYEYLLLHKDTIVNNFKNLCSRLVTCLDDKSSISADNLSSFSHFLRFIFTSDVDFNTDEFKTLCYMIRNYWHHSLLSDDNLQRQCSYTQLYQMVMMVKVYYDDKDLENRVSHDIADYCKDFDLIETIYTSPGISFKKLSEEFLTDKPDLKSILDELEDKGFVITRREGDYKYFILSRSGDILYRFLEIKNRKGC